MNKSLERLNNVMRAIKSETTYYILINKEGNASLHRFDENWRSHLAIDWPAVPIKELNPLIDIYTAGVIDMKVLL